jgi:hypothetical protein
MITNRRDLSLRPKLRGTAESPATCAKWVLTGILPASLPVIGKYDMRALIAALDKLSGINSVEQSDDSFEIWKRGRDAKTSSRH